MKCTCGSIKIRREKGYDSVYRCEGCNKVGNALDFAEDDFDDEPIDSDTDERIDYDDGDEPPDEFE